MRSRLVACLVVVGGALAACLGAAGVAAAGLPPEDECPLLGGIPGGAPSEDAVPTLVREGTMLGFSDLLLLRGLLPDEVWRNRDQFFHDGMRMLIGPCHRRYPAPRFYDHATQEFAGRSTIDRHGNLSGYVAGLPFPPDRIDPEAGDAGVRWAWNLEHRYRGAGPSGRFRIVDLPGRRGGEQRYEGTFFFAQTSHRADLPETGYALPGSEDTLWVAGGRFLKPFNARHLAWRQVRPASVQERYSEPDDTFVYVPSLRKVRRSATSWVDGMFTPRYRVSGDTVGAGTMPAGDPLGGGTLGPVNPAAAGAVHVTENLRRGFVGLSLRPNAYAWKLHGFREVLAPINSARSGYPAHADRNFGASGLSVGSDRWDVRYAVLLEGASRERGSEYNAIFLYVDYQTQQPLYVITKRGRGLLVDVGILVHRFSGDVADYPDWPGKEKAYVFDPVLASFYAGGDGSGWRRESYDVKSTPLEASEIRRYLSSDYLARGR
ncbi:MAG: DUF1329 domain-containing protein [Myxococcales bacterium]|nr:DUF1329 domain-containing protein [Myxococcales bacterium]